MNIIYQSTGGQSPYQERIEATSVIEIDAIDMDALQRLSADLSTAGATLADKGPLSIAAEFDQASARLRVTITGSLPATIGMINFKCATGQRLFADDCKMSAGLRIDPIDDQFAGSVSGYLLASAKHHPREKGQLRIESGYEPAERRLRLEFSGNVFAIAYLYMIVYARFTQRLVRETCYV